MIEWIRSHCERTPVVLAGVGVSAAVLHSSQTLGLGRPLLPDVRAAAGADRQPGDRRRAARRAPARGHRRRRRSRPCPLRRGGSVGFSARLGGWSSPPPVSWGQVATAATAVSLIVGPPAAYVVSRVVRRRHGRPAPALRGGLALVAFFLIFSGPSVPGMAIFN